MSKMLTLMASASILLAISASASMTIFNGYAYVSDTTAGVGSTWYDLNGSAQPQDFQGSDLGNFETSLWLGGQTGLWQDEGGVASAMLHYSISGDATASGSISYSFESYSAPNDQWGTDINGANLSEGSLDLIATHSLGNGSYNLSVWVQGVANGGGNAWDNNGGSNHTATFEVVPEPAVMGLVLVFGGSMLFIRRMFQM
ncbi:hypothetical protein P4B35_06760 [Pontiellaceae bacterium B12227]|nr:hypothetical protein [Pontiellaceae bacterium B12227]